MTVCSVWVILEKKALCFHFPNGIACYVNSCCFPLKESLHQEMRATSPLNYRAGLLSLAFWPRASSGFWRSVTFLGTIETGRCWWMECILSTLLWLPTQISYCLLLELVCGNSLIPLLMCESPGYKSTLIYSITAVILAFKRQSFKKNCISQRYFLLKISREPILFTSG